MPKKILEEIPNKYEILYGLLKSTANGKLLVDMSHSENKIIYANEAFINTTGYTVHEVVGKPIGVLKSIDEHDTISKDVLQNLSTYKELNIETSIRKKDGSKLACELTATPIFDQLGYIRYYIFNFIDVAYKSEIEDLKCILTEEMKLSIQYKDAIDESSIVSKTDLKGNITHVNDLFCEMSQYTRYELLGKPHNIVRHPDTPKSVFEDMWNTILNKKVWHGVVTNRKKDGTAYFVNATVKPILDTKGDIVEFISIRHDITDRIMAEKKIEAALTSKNAFFAKVSHELRTPLNAIINFSEMILDDYELICSDKETNETSKDFIERISKNSKHLLALINDLLDISKAENKGIEISKIQLSSVIQNAVSFVTPAANKKGLSINVLCDMNTINVYANERALLQVCLNLLSNSIKFTNEGFISIKCIDNERHIVVNIEDSGIGIPEEKIDKIFEPFEQARPSDEGTGLGLKLVKEMCEAMDIKLSVSSKENNGTIFQLLIRKAE